MTKTQKTRLIKNNKSKTLKNLITKIRPSNRIKAKKDWQNFKQKVVSCGPFSPLERTGLHTLDEFFLNIVSEQLEKVAGHFQMLSQI